MNPQEDPRLSIVALRGLPITVAAMLCKYAQPVSQAHLCHLLCYSDKTMSTALHRLQEFQIVSHSELGWSVTGYVALLGFSLPEWLQTPDETGTVENAVEKDRKISDPNPLTTSSTSSIKLTNKKLEKNLVLVDPKNKIKPKPKTGLEPEADSEPEPKPDQELKNPELIQACRQAALRSGIGEPKATIIAELKHTTPEMIAQYVKAALAQGQRIGLAIHWLEKNTTLNQVFEQEFSEQEYLEQEARDRADRKRYVSGRYADSIEH